ncbi:MAG: Glu/Leu/Phe/Val dehydrogenase dimerization domain-containing protein [Nitriliruptoraceae bacterium]
MAMDDLTAGTHEQVIVTRLADTGVTCIIAIHSTRLGPALGGTRIRDYPSFDDALTDVLRLSAAMTHKNACAGLDFGGGKAVIIGDPAKVRTEPVLRAYGRAIAGLAGRYITACDVGSTPADMAMIRRETRWATGTHVVEGGSGDSGVLTATGVHLAIRTGVTHALGADSLRGIHVAVQGLGKVGARLVGHLVADGAKVTVADVDADALARTVDEYGVDTVETDEILAVNADVVSPNALGAVLNEATIPTLQARLVCGGANNQLATAEDAVRLRDHGIVYAPDFVVNAGGVINLAQELHPEGYSVERARARLESIPATLQRVLGDADAAAITTEEAAARLVDDRLASIEASHRFWLRPTPE